MNKKISVVMVTYNSYPYFKQSIALMELHLSELVSEIIVIDNNSPDQETTDYLDCLENKNDTIKIRVVRLERNTGISIGMNLGVAMSENDVILIFNNDIYVDENGAALFSHLLQKLIDHDDVGIISPLFVKENGEPDINFTVDMDILNMVYSRISNIFSTKQKMNALDGLVSDEEGYAKVRLLSGQFFLMKKKIFEVVGGFDESYFVYSTDWDFAEKINHFGLKNIVYTGASLVHGVGMSTSRAKFRSTMDLYTSFARFLLKWKVYPTLNKLFFKTVFFIPVVVELTIRYVKGNKNVSD